MIQSKKCGASTEKKQWTTNGAIADVLTVMVRTEFETPEGKKDKITAFLVTSSIPGFHMTAAALEKVGMRGSKTAKMNAFAYAMEATTYLTAGLIDH
ncbi:MAG: acyl-CoA dehydrogenase family protein [Parachlamydiaceae bacterium]